MIQWIIWFWAMFCSNPNHTAASHGNCNLIHISTTNSFGEEGDGGDETGNFPPRNPTPPPPPPPPPPGT